jgi:hypothetical protein
VAGLGCGKLLLTLRCLLTPANLSPPAFEELWSSGGGGIPVSVRFTGWVLRLDDRISLHLSSPLKPVMTPLSQEPLTARVQTAFFGAVPAQAIIQDTVLQALGSLQETEGLQLEMLLPVLGQCLFLCSCLPSLCLPDLPSSSSTQHCRVKSLIFPMSPQGTLAPSVLGTATTLRSLWGL